MMRGSANRRQEQKRQSGEQDLHNRDYIIFATHFVNAENPTLTFQIRRVSGQPSKTTRRGTEGLTIEFQKRDIDFALDGDPVGLMRRFTTVSQNLVTLVEIHLDGLFVLNRQCSD